MIVLDTNVISGALRPSLMKRCFGGWRNRIRDRYLTPALRQAEMPYRIEMLPAGKRRNRLRTAVERLFAEEFLGRVLSFDGEAAGIYANIVSDRERRGRPISQFDAVIASVCRLRNAALAYSECKRLRIVRIESDRSVERLLTQSDSGGAGCGSGIVLL